MDDELDGQTLEPEQREWRNFVVWNDLYETGLATIESHPGQRGVDAEYDRLNDCLEPLWTPPASSHIAHATWTPLGRGKRPSADGPDSAVHWGEIRARSR